MHQEILITLTMVVILGIGAQWLAWRAQLPSILLLLSFGLVAGPVTGYVDPNALLGDLLLPFVSVSVALILFEGGLTLNIIDLTQIRRVLLNLISLGVVVTWLVASASGYWILGLHLPLALLLGAILTVSGPTVVLPLLRHVQPIGQVSSILRWEGIVVDPIGAMLAVIVFETITARHPGDSNAFVIVTVLRTIAVGALLGALSARVVTFLLNRYWVPDFLQNPVTLMIVVATFTGSNLLQAESGLLAVTVMGVMLANQNTVSVKHIIEFKENLRVLLLSGLFILLAARLEPDQLLGFGVREALFLAILILVARPLAVAISSLKSTLTWRERLFIAWMAPRGIVAAAVASVFALELRNANYAQAERLVPLTFFVILATVVIYGLTAGPLSRWLQVAKPSSEGFLIVGAHSWAREIARALQQEECAVMLVDSNRANVAEARLEGLSAFHSNVLSPEIVEEIDLGGYGRLLALTSNDEVNSLAALHFVDLFGRAGVFQLPLEAENGAAKDPIIHHLRGRFLFGPDMTFHKLSESFACGAQIRNTALTEKFSFNDFRARYGPKALPLFVVGESGKVTVMTAGEEWSPKPGQRLVSLVPTLEQGSAQNFDRSADRSGIAARDKSKPI